MVSVLESLRCGQSTSKDVPLLSGERPIVCVVSLVVSSIRCRIVADCLLRIVECVSGLCVRLSPLGLLNFDGSSSCMSSRYVRCLVECCIYLYIAATFL